MARSAHTHVMFQNGRAEDALRRYEEVFGGDFHIDGIDRYDESAPGPTGKVQLAVTSLLGQRITWFDSPIRHGFDMTPSISLFVDVDDDDELDRLVAELGAGGETFMPLGDYGFSRRFGWVADRFGVSWQLNLP